MSSGQEFLSVPAAEAPDHKLFLLSMGRARPSSTMLRLFRCGSALPKRI